MIHLLKMVICSFATFSIVAANLVHKWQAIDNATGEDVLQIAVYETLHGNEMINCVKYEDRNLATCERAFEFEKCLIPYVTRGSNNSTREEVGLTANLMSMVWTGATSGECDKTFPHEVNLAIIVITIVVFATMGLTAILFYQKHRSRINSVRSGSYLRSTC